MSKQQSLMRGIQINNFFENHISLNGKKINNKIETIIQAHRPKPLIINHQKAPVQQLLLSEKSPVEKKSAVKSDKKRKRIVSSLTNQKTIKINVNQFTATKNQNIQKIRQKQTSNKKERSTSGKKKRKSISPQKSKKQNYPSPLKQNSSEEQSQEYFHNADTINQITASHKKIKPLYKLEERFGRSKSTIIKPLNPNKTSDVKSKFNPKSSQKNKEMKNIPEKSKKKEQKQSKPNKSKEATKNKQAKLNSERKSFKVINFPKDKSNMTSARQTKVSSAREEKERKKKTIFNQSHKIAEKLKDFNNQGELYKEKYHEIIDKNNVKARIEDFSQMLTHLKTRKTFKKEFQIIQKKINNIVSNNHSEDQQGDEEDNSEDPQNDKEGRLVAEGAALNKSDSTQKIDLDAQEYNQGARRIFMEEIQKQLFQKQQEYTEIKFEVKEEDKNRQVESEDKKQHHHANSNDNVAHFHNPILERKFNIQKNQENYDQEYNSIKSYSKEEESERVALNSIQKMKQIECLKRFKLQSNKMMEKLKSKQQKKKKQDEGNSSKQSLQQNNKRIIYDEKYPSVKSPKFNELELNSILIIKERYVNDKHNKMSQLVDKMFQKNIVSPKSYEIQVLNLGKMQEEDHNTLQNFKRQAQHLTSMIKQIKKDKEEIKGIDELIKDQKWEEALQLIKKYQPTISKEQKLPEKQEVKNQKQAQQISSAKESQQELKKIQDQEQEIINYLPQEQDDSSSKLIQLIPIQENVDQNDEIPELPQGKSKIVIKIDEDVSAVQPKPVRGFQSNLYFIKQYCIALCQYIKENPSKLQDFKKNISNPLQFKLPALLASYRTTINGLPCQSYSTFSDDLQYPYVKKKWTSDAISLKAFQEFNFSYDKLKCNRVEDCSAIDRILQGIFIKSIYQALNESLNYERPCSIHGKPLPWMNQGKHLKNHKYNNINSLTRTYSHNQLEAIDQIFGVAIARVIQWGSCICGFIPDTLDLQNTQIDEEYVVHLRETRMALLLQKMLVQEEGQLQNTQMFQTQVILSAGQKIFKELIQEAEKQFKIVQIRSTLRSVDY